MPESLLNFLGSRLFLGLALVVASLCIWFGAPVLMEYAQLSRTLIALSVIIYGPITILLVGMGVWYVVTGLIE